jgi:hypothetical protein
MTTKPVDLIVTNKLHSVAEAFQLAPRQMREAADLSRLADETMRGLLCSIAHDARPEVVAKALAAIGVPGGVDAIRERFQTVLDIRTAEATALGIDLDAEGEKRRYQIADKIISSFANALKVHIAADTDETPTAQPSTNGAAEPVATSH